MLLRDTITDRDTWNNALATLPYAHVLQSWEWGEVKRVTTGWQPQRWLFRRAADGTPVGAVSLGVRRAGPFTVMYAPKGPTFPFHDATLSAALLDALQHQADSARALWLKIDPDVVLGTGVPSEPDAQEHADGTRLLNDLRARGWRFSDDQPQFRNSVVLDLTPSEDALLAAMSQNTRRKVRAAAKHGVTVRPASEDDIPTLLALYRETATRDGFLIRPAAYYDTAWRTMMQGGLAHALLAEVGGRAVAHVILFVFGRTCWYFYGASSNHARETMPNYLLQWEAMRWAREHGCTHYDLWGAPNVFHEQDPMWGVYAFKRGFRGGVVRHIGAWDYAPSPLLYNLYTRGWPRLRAWLRGRSATPTPTPTHAPYTDGG